jgi:hypothetical protein
MFTKRQTVILRMLLSYGLSNLDDIRRAFAPVNEAALTKEELQEEALNFNGEIICPVTEDEVGEILNLLQG